ncbi:MAG: ComF family protein [Flammeovirgaceae bacterium]
MTLSSTTSQLKYILEDFLHLLFPNTCIACQGDLHRNEGLICTYCRQRLPITNYHLNPENPLAQRFWGRVPVKHAFAYLKYIKYSSVQQIIHALKYQGKEELSELLGLWYGYDLAHAGFRGEFDYILPVPLHASRQKQRGYNQSDGFAKGLAQSLETTWNPHTLKRIKASQTQTNKSRYNRWLNVKDLFVVADSNALKNKHILLVDDVITTGATTEACLQSLLDAGCAQVSVAAIGSAK